MLAANRLAQDFDWKERDDEGRIRIRDFKDRWSDFCDLNAEFLAQFANGSLAVGFAQFDFPAWKFPTPTMSFVTWPKTDEQLLLAANHAGDNSLADIR